MTPQEKIDFFWASGILPGTLFDDMNDQHRKDSTQPQRRRVHWIRLVSLGLLG